MQKNSSRALWRNRDFLLLWAGQAVSSIGSQISAFALPLLVLALTNSPAQAGLLTALQRAPYLLFSLPVGALIDRWNRKHIMLLADGLRCVVYALVPAPVLAAHLTLPLLAVVAVLSGAAYVFFDIADGSSFPRIVTPAQLPNASALMEGALATADLLGPGIGGFIVGLAWRSRHYWAALADVRAALGCQRCPAGARAVAPLLVAGWGLLTMMSPIYFATSYSYRVLLVDDALQGRVNSVYRLLAQVGVALGPALGGALLALISTRAELWAVVAGFGLCAALIGFTGLLAVGKREA